jgi:hypothetical protein
MYNPRILKYATSVTFSPRWELVDGGVYNRRMLKQTVNATFSPHQVVASFTTSVICISKGIQFHPHYISFLSPNCAFGYSKSYRNDRPFNWRLQSLLLWRILRLSGMGIFLRKVTEPTPTSWFVSALPRNGESCSEKHAVVSGLTCSAYLRRFSAIRLCSVMDISQN